MSILVVDGMGGGLGAQIIMQTRNLMPEREIIAAGTNSTATTNMVKAGATKGATGVNAIKVCLRNAECIIGPLGIILADAMLGEITPEIACLIGSATMPKVLVPVSHKDIDIIGLQENLTMSDLIKKAVKKVKEKVEKS
ncbi:MAG: hypothetical protein CVU87_06345 [Firmicutes bacterium HGW-Firmicutes-12]|nr:MAG: hypothetical protein CVU87_06345 [Firmicutes bacterium HGW-Firmicutes-12]